MNAGSGVVLLVLGGGPGNDRVENEWIPEPGQLDRDAHGIAHLHRGWELDTGSLEAQVEQQGVQLDAAFPSGNSGGKPDIPACPQAEMTGGRHGSISMVAELAGRTIRNQPDNRWSATVPS